MNPFNVGPKSDVLVIYHGNCMDGFAAAWCAWKAFGKNPTMEVVYHPGIYNNPPPDCTDKYVYILDFSYKREVMTEIIEQAKFVTWIDHHKTAIEQNEGLDILYPEKLNAVLDLNKSGAGLTWDYFFDGSPRPALLNHVEDRDLWRFKLPGTREIIAAVFSYPYDFETYDHLMRVQAGDGQLFKEGFAIERKHHKDVAELVEALGQTMFLDGVEIPVANIPYTMTSDAGALMAKNHPSKMAACYWDTKEGRVFSLRSTEDGPDVAEIAARFNGGGHQHASGFRLSPDKTLRILENGDGYMVLNSKF